MINRKNGLNSLSLEDRDFVIKLCQEHTYRDVVILLAEPRPAGLALRTSSSALCRFYTLWHPALYALNVDRQTTAAIADTPDDDVLRATLILIQINVFRSLHRGDPIQQNLSSLRFMLSSAAPSPNSETPHQLGRKMDLDPHGHDDAGFIPSSVLPRDVEDHLHHVNFIPSRKIPQKFRKKAV